MPSKKTARKTTKRAGPTSKKKMARKAGRKRHPAPAKKTPKWQIVENVVAAVERVRAVIPGVEVTQKAQIPKAAFPDQTRDVDVLVEIPVQGRKIRLGIEVKNERRPIAEDELGTLVDLKNDLQLDRYCVVSTSGYTSAAHQKAAQNGIELSTLRPSDGSPFFASPPGELITLRHVHVLAADANGPQSVLEELRGLAGDAVQVVAQGVSRTLHQTIVASAHRAVSEGHTKGQDGEEFEFTQSLDPATCYLTTPTSPRLDPVAFDVRVRFESEKVADLRFTLGGLQISTWELDGPRGRLQQTSVGVPSPDDPTQYRLHFTSGPARPPKAVVKPNPLVAS